MEGHSTGKKKTEMNTKKQIILLALVITLLLPATSGALEIQQEPYTYRMAMVRDVTSDTFVIIDRLPSNEAPAISCRISLVYFELGSASLSTVAAETILSDLKRCEGMYMAPLLVVGHACQLGPEKVNQTLSLQRARTVAHFLQKNGLSVTTVQGKGSQQPITHDSQEFYKNRRVEIVTLQKK
jgi:outer membrane protein OmpA-like peptidoglycan-associated protein